MIRVTDIANYNARNQDDSDREIKGDIKAYSGHNITRKSALKKNSNHISTRTSSTSTAASRVSWSTHLVDVVTIERKDEILNKEDIYYNADDYDDFEMDVVQEEINSNAEIVVSTLCRWMEENYSDHPREGILPPSLPKRTTGNAVIISQPPQLPTRRLSLSDSNSASIISSDDSRSSTNNISLQISTDIQNDPPKVLERVILLDTKNDLRPTRPTRRISPTIEIPTSAGSASTKMTITKNKRMDNNNKNTTHHDSIFTLCPLPLFVNEDCTAKNPPKKLETNDKDKNANPAPNTSRTSRRISSFSLSSPKKSTRSINLDGNDINAVLVELEKQPEQNLHETREEAKQQQQKEYEDLTETNNDDNSSSADSFGDFDNTGLQYSKNKSTDRYSNTSLDSFSSWSSSIHSDTSSIEIPIEALCPKLHGKRLSIEIEKERFYRRSTGSTISSGS